MKLKDLYRLKFLTRYQNVPHLLDESVAEHSFYVALGCLLICDRLGESDQVKCKLMAAGLCHDLPEILLTDVPHNVKRRFPGIADAVSEAEAKVWRDYLPHLSQYMALSDREEKILKLADSLSVVLYSTQELSLGRSEEFDYILSEASRTVCKLQQELGIEYASI